MKIKLEICIDSLPSALASQEGGADRVELCDNLSVGGTTPSYGVITRARELLNIGLYVIIRPRGGDFVYSDDEFEIMLRDVQICRHVRCDGVVIGLLTKNGEVDTKRTKQLVEAAGPLGVTFHRAFDWTRSPFQALEDLIDCGCERVLTMGQESAPVEGIPLLNQLVQKANDRIIIMPGAANLGVKDIKMIAEQTGANEFHTTADQEIPSSMVYKNSLAMREDSFREHTATDTAKVRSLVEGLL